MTTTKRITAFNVIDHGIEHCQYFQGCGVAFTKYDHVVTGCGNNAVEALEDAFESAAQGDHRFTEEQTESMLAEITSYQTDDVSDVETSDDDRFGTELYYYVSIQYSVSEEGK